MYHELKKLFGGRSLPFGSLTLRFVRYHWKNKIAITRRLMMQPSQNGTRCPEVIRPFCATCSCTTTQRTADYLRRHTVLGVLGYPLREPELLRRLLALLEQGTASYRHLAFALLLVFPYPETIDYLSDKLRLERLTTDDLCELLDRMRLDNEPGRGVFLM